MSNINPSKPFQNYSPQ
uniref:Uncharacterized protein n=1 Tax=Arundo donax TaxID=35708 RepID=A0A0A9CQJ6_ARUDO